MGERDAQRGQRTAKGGLEGLSWAGWPEKSGLMVTLQQAGKCRGNQVRSRFFSPQKGQNKGVEYNVNLV